MPDVPFEIDATMKFTTNLDSNSSFNNYNKNSLKYTYRCVFAASVSNMTPLGDCCIKMFRYANKKAIRLK